MGYAREQEIIRLLYLISLYNSGHIQTIQFLDEGITITYTNNKQTQFYFETVRAYNKDGFENKITDNLITMLIVSEDPSIEGNEDAIVKYYSFDLEGKEESNKVEGSNEIKEIEDDEEEFGDNDDEEIEDNDDEIEDNDDEIGDNDDEFGDNNNEFGDNNDEFGDNNDEDKEEIVNKKRKIKELQTSKKRFKSDITLTSNKLKAEKLYKEFLSLEKGLPVVAPFFDDDAQVHKSVYYRNIKKHLKTIMQQSSTSKIIQFDSSLINGALSMDLYQEEQEPAISILSEFDNSNLRDQINLLRKVPELPSNILMNTSLLTNSNNQQILMFSSLMSMCYK
ncbi:hypothetical protein C2G38_2138294 [Gigaspora rosea]|uniref:Uncharacterized protein n=1 Tax=Gigaspora rosea TaxID=44941 RepID=A0A397VV25_9GLOM|nr:hypothetical protein C2G38_2138294 [Gigaspora rosea]